MNNKKIIIMLALILTAAAAYFLTAAMKDATEVNTEIVQTRKMCQVVSVTGKIEPLDMETIVLSSQQKVKNIYVQEGQVVKKNDLILTVDTADLEYQLKKYRLDLDLATAGYNEAQRKLEQYRTLYETGAVSKEQYDGYEKQVNDRRIQVESAQADIANTGQEISKGTVKASIGGRIVRLEVKENQYPTADNNLIVIYDLSEYKMRGEVSQYNAVSISPGQKAVIKVKGLDQEYTGTVVKIDEAANIKTEADNQRARVGVEITVDNPDDKIKAGYEADIDIVITEFSHTIAVDSKSLQMEKDGRQSVLVIENGVAVKKYVRTGIKNDLDIQITEGLKTGEQYIKNPSAALKDGDRVSASKGIGK